MMTESELNILRNELIGDLESLRMDVDFAGFESLSVSLEEAEARRSRYEYANDMLDKCLDTIKQVFEDALHYIKSSKDAESIEPEPEPESSEDRICKRLDMIYTQLLSMSQLLHEDRMNSLLRDDYVNLARLAED